MNLSLQVGGYIVGLILQFLTINSMRNGAYRRYPFLFLYVLVDVITALLEIWPNLQYRMHDGNVPVGVARHWAMIYWIDEWIMQGLVFLLVISLIYVASSRMRPRGSLILLLVSGTVLIAGISWWIHFSPDLKWGKWMTPWTRDMYFAAAVLNLGLWAMLIGSRERDRRVLMVSGALGIQFTGNAIGQALREISHSTVDATAVLIMIANLTCMFIWWQAFRPRELPQKTLSGRLTTKNKRGGPLRVESPPLVKQD